MIRAFRSRAGREHPIGDRSRNRRSNRPTALGGGTVGVEIRPMLYVLTFLACLGNGPERLCDRVELPWDGPEFRCQLFGQMEVVRWLREHPGFVLEGGWRCERGRGT